MKKTLILTMSLIFLLSCFACSVNKKINPNEIIGVSHVGGKYFLTNKPYLIEGAEAIKDMGSNIIKLWFTNQYKELYAFNSKWEDANSLVDLAKTAYYASVFEMDFSTYILETYEFFGDRQTDWSNGLTSEEKNEVSNAFYEITKYFMQTYSKTNKTFILQNWEADNALVGFNVKQANGVMSNKTKTAFNGMIDWINSRQDGVDRAKKELEKSCKDVFVFNAFEVCHIDVENDMEDYSNKFLTVDYIVPKLHCDLYSFSSWGTKQVGLEQLITTKLQYLKDKAPKSKTFGENNIYLGEFGAPESLFKKQIYYNTSSSQIQMEVVKKQLELAVDFGVRYAIYWEIYCNEGRKPIYESNEDGDGYWLIRKDGSKTMAYSYFKNIFDKNQL